MAFSLSAFLRVGLDTGPMPLTTERVRRICFGGRSGGLMVEGSVWKDEIILRPVSCYGSAEVRKKIWDSGNISAAIVTAA